MAHALVRAVSALQPTPALLIIAALLTACAHKPSYETEFRNIGALQAAGDTKTALVQVERVLHIASPDQHWYWKFYLLKTELVQQQTGPAAALKLLDAVSIPDRPDYKDLCARKKLQEAKAWFYLSEYATADLLLRQAKAYAADAGSSEIQFDIAIWRASSFARKGDWASAEEAAREATKIASGTGQKQQEAIVYGIWGFIDLQRSRFEEAIHSFNQQLPLISPDRPATLAAAFNNLGWCSFKLGDTDKALQYFKQALPLFRSASERQGGLGNLGNVYLNRGNWAQAKQYYEQAIALNPGDRHYNAKWYGNLAEIAIQLHDWNTAEDYNRKAKEASKDKTDLYAVFHEARIAQGRGDFAHADTLYREVLATKSDDPTPKLEAQSLIAELYAETGRADKAEAGFQAALALSQGHRSRLVSTAYKISYLDSKIRFYRDYVDFMMSHGHQDRALEIAEASRAQVLNERLGVQNSGRAIRGAEYKQLAAQSHAVLLSYWLAPERSYVWVITGKDISARPLPPMQQVTDRVERYRAFIENVRNPLDSDEPSGKELYDMVVKPVMDCIPEGSRVIIIPDGPLYALNFETLPVLQPAPHYLIDDVVISGSPSLNLLTVMASRTATRAPGESILLIGDPSNAYSHFPKLQYAGAEIDAIKRHFGGAQVEEFRDSKAVPAVYTDGSPGTFRYLHFAAHAVADKLNPLESAIILSGPGDAGRLTAAQVLRKPLAADLVTLSACDTAGGRTYAGEGLVGFAWAFLHSGAHNVIGGLWEVSDDTTPQIMDRLYQGLAAGEDLAQALRAAKLAVMHSAIQYRQPYYWGAFQLYGGAGWKRVNPPRHANTTYSVSSTNRSTDIE